MLADNFRENVSRRLAMLRWTRTELAEEMGKTQPYVSHYLNGTRSPGLEVVEMFATALGVKPQSLLETPRKQAEKKVQSTA